MWINWQNSYQENRGSRSKRTPWKYHGWLRRCPKDSYLDNAWEIQLPILQVEGPHPKYQNYQGRKIWTFKVSIFSTEGGHIRGILLSLVHLIKHIFTTEPFGGKILGDVLDTGWVHHQAKFGFLIPKHLAAIYFDCKVTSLLPYSVQRKVILSS